MTRVSSGSSSSFRTTIRWLIDHRHAASVLRDPVGAAINVSCPWAMCAHPWDCGAVGSAKRSVNQRRMRGLNDDRSTADLVYVLVISILSLFGTACPRPSIEG